jgi:hypothetical protein
MDLVHLLDQALLVALLFKEEIRKSLSEQNRTLTYPHLFSPTYSLTHPLTLTLTLTLTHALTHST